MRSATLAFLLGLSCIVVFAMLPRLYLLLAVWVTLFCVSFLLPQRFKIWICLLLIAVSGLAWVVLRADLILSWSLPTEYIGKSIIVTGTVASIPELKNSNLNFVFKITDLTEVHAEKSSARTTADPKSQTGIQGQIKNKHSVLIRLNWYYPPKQLNVGDKWQLTIRLKPARGFWDVGAFDYQKWLFDQEIRAIGYVVPNSAHTFLGETTYRYFIDKERQKIATLIGNDLSQKPLVGLITALAVGVRDHITESQWSTLRGTGTNHLFAIAGLHIGLVIGIVHSIILFFWRYTGRVLFYFPASQAAAISSLLIAVIYSALAGFSIPTQRAIVMVTVFLLATLLRKNLLPWSAWCLALLIILLFDPLAILVDSFCLSLGAVAFIIYGGGGRINQKGLWWHWGRIQWVMAVGLIPFCLLFFQQTALAGFIANSIAIPWVGFSVLPLTLLGSLFLSFAPHFAALCWRSAEWLLELLWPVLEHIAQLEWLQWRVYINNPWILIAAIIAVLLLLAPRGFYGRWLGIIWGLPLVFWTPAGPQQNQIWFTLLDVGHALSAVIRTQHHVLVYDTGPRFNTNFDTGNAVVVPFLRSQGITMIDTLMISHGTNEHMGGFNSIISELDVKQILSTVPQQLTASAALCMQGQHWEWDGVVFQVLSPFRNKLESSAIDNRKGHLLLENKSEYQTLISTRTDKELNLNSTEDKYVNNNSCVLRVEIGKQSILLTSDINLKTEHELVTHSADLLPSSILVAPRHGARLSSSSEFINAVKPQYVLFSTGYLNRYHLPNIEVLDRYRKFGSSIYTTADDGAITFRLIEKGEIKAPVTYKNMAQHFWYNVK